MMLEIVTLLNAAQTYWRLTVLHNAHERQICRGVFDIGVLNTHKHANRSSLSISNAEWQCSLCTHQKKHTLPGNCRHCDLPHCGTSCSTSNPVLLELSRGPDTGWQSMTPAHPEKWMQAFIITGSTQHIIDPNKDPHVKFKRHSLMALKPRRALTQLSN